MDPKRKLCNLARLLVCLVMASTTQVFGAGVTIITHGLSSSIDDWVISMAGKIPAYSRFPGTNFSCYEIYFTLVNNIYVPTWRRLSGTVPLATDSAEIIVKLDWRQLANNSYSTFQVASSVVPTLLQSGFISEFPGHALAELPIHLVGHSRGGSLVCEMSLLLGTNGVWVDHLTTLDPHPLNNDGFADFPFTVVDAPAHSYENVLFHDNYFQKIASPFVGEAVAGAYARQLQNLDGGYSGLGGAHSDVHLWYHGTIDLQTPTSDTVSAITSAERTAWWNGAENLGASAGFLYSLIGGGDRLGTNQPGGAGTTNRIRDGYNQRWDLGAGNNTNRTILSTNRGTWPNLITADLPAPHVMAYGQSNALELFYQWVQPAASNATVDLFLDDDFSPFNGNERHLQSMLVSGTPSGLPGNPALPFALDVANSSPGVHSLFARITGNGKTRYLYAPQTLTVMSSFDPPRLTLADAGPEQVQIDVDGIAGQRIVLERSANLLGWQPVATNWLTQARWSYFDTASPQNFYRAEVR